MRDQCEYSFRNAPCITIGRSIGVMGFYLGSNFLIIDILALSEPLLSKIPPSENVLRATAHVTRLIPEGYIVARLSGNTRFMDPDLAEYYKKLRLVISGDLWEWERIKTIVGFQLGQYDYLLDAYINRMKTNIPLPQNDF